jgi:serine/threonine protein kinase
MFIMLSGTPPFYHEDNFELFELIKLGSYTFDAPAWKDISKEAKDLIERLLVVDPEKRITPNEIRSHPWITGDYKKVSGNLNVLNKMREWNTKRKINLDQ